MEAISELHMAACRRTPGFHERPYQTLGDIEYATAAPDTAKPSTVKSPSTRPPVMALVEARIAKSSAEHRLGPFWRSEEFLAAAAASYVSAVKGG